MLQYSILASLYKLLDWLKQVLVQDNFMNVGFCVTGYIVFSWNVIFLVFKLIMELTQLISVNIYFAVFTVRAQINEH